MSDQSLRERLDVVLAHPPTGRTPALNATGQVTSVGRAAMGKVSEGSRIALGLNINRCRHWMTQWSLWPVTFSMANLHAEIGIEAATKQWAESGQAVLQAIGAKP